MPGFLFTGLYQFGSNRSFHWDNLVYAPFMLYYNIYGINDPF